MSNGLVVVPGTVIPGEPRLVVEGEGDEFEYILNLPPWTPITMDDGSDGNGDNGDDGDDGEDGDEPVEPTSMPPWEQQPPAPMHAETAPAKRRTVRKPAKRR